jgi:hypothetical protein
LLFGVLKRNVRSPNYALTPIGAVAALARLREQTLPSLADIPFFNPRARATAADPTWAGQLTRQAFFAAIFAAAVLAVAISMPAILSSRGGGSTSSAWALHSSVGVTGTSDTLVADLSVGTFVGRVPFVQQLQYYSDITGSAPAVARFAVGAREASLAAYVQGVGQQVTLPYLNDAVTKKQSIDQWNNAVALYEKRRKSEQEDSVYGAVGLLAAGQIASSQAWQAPALAIGTHMAATSTFYACIGNGYCGAMANGETPYLGAAACSYNLPFGTRFRIENDPSGRVFTCVDRGALTPTWVDVWFYNATDGWAWQSLVGTRSNIIIVG